MDHATSRVPQLHEEAMKEAAWKARMLVFREGDEKIQDVARRSVQHPRVFYRREPEADPLVVAGAPRR